MEAAALIGSAAAAALACLGYDGGKGTDKREWGISVLADG